MSYNVSLWGGASYSWPDDCERFPTLAAARDQWLDNRDCQYSNGTPCWGDPTNVDERGRWYGAFAYFVDESDPDQARDLQPGDYPDYVLVIGPRGGATWERC